MSYQLRIKTPAQKEIRSLPGNIRAQAVQIIDSLLQNPRPSRSKELRGKPGFFRIWLAGRWRIVYTIDDDAQVILIMRVRLKDDIDYTSIGTTDE